MHRGVASGAPASALAQVSAVGRMTDVNLPGSDPSALHLRMAFQAQVRVVFDQQLPVNRAVRIMTHRAAFSQRFMLENKRPRLFAMTFGAVFIEARHRESSPRFENVAAVWVVALNTIHPSLDHRMA